jgi:hypothetical protein
MKHLRLGLVAILMVLVGALCLWWAVDLRWRPPTLNRDQGEIAGILQGAGWVSPKLPGPKLYVIAYRDCAACLAFEAAEFPKLQGAGVDTRVIMIARADLNGQARSTAPERATVAQLWIGRDWGLFGRWMAAQTPWAAPGIAPADGDTARTAVVAAGRSMVETLSPLMKHNGVRFAYPMLFWWDAKGVMHGCACVRPPSWRPVEKEL